MNKVNKKSVVSGMRTTGSMHLGHYHGVLKNWLSLQKKHKCYFFAADLHAMTTYKNVSNSLKDNTTNMILEWLSAGIDPKNSCIFVQSCIPEHSELHLLLSMIVPVNWLTRIPSYKDKNNSFLKSYGFLGYPILQSSDILLYNPDYIPIGEDQISHIEITRKIARMFNSTFGKKINVGQSIQNNIKLLDKKNLNLFIQYIKNYKKKNCIRSLKLSKEVILRSIYKKKQDEMHNLSSKINVFKEPKILLGRYPKLMGADGKKMSKSYKNTINLIESSGNLKKKIMKTPTDPYKIKVKDPGNPDNCSVWQFHILYNNTLEKSIVKNNCTKGYISCKDCKSILLKKMQEEHNPIREKYTLFKSDQEYVDNIIQSGNKEARAVAKKTLFKVKKAINFLL